MYKILIKSKRLLNTYHPYFKLNSATGIPEEFSCSTSAELTAEFEELLKRHPIDSLKAVEEIEPIISISFDGDPT